MPFIFLRPPAAPTFVTDAPAPEAACQNKHPSGFGFLSSKSPGHGSTSQRRRCYYSVVPMRKRRLREGTCVCWWQEWATVSTSSFGLNVVVLAPHPPAAQVPSCSARTERTASGSGEDRGGGGGDNRQGHLRRVTDRKGQQSACPKRARLTRTIT